MYVQVNIGRNIANEPMAPTEWRRFNQSVIGALSDSHRSITCPDTEIHRGEGSWVSEEGMVWEESAHISAFGYDFDLDKLRGLLSGLAKEYNQDSIALITNSELIGA